MSNLEEQRRVLVTGAEGFVGRHLISHLLEAFQANGEANSWRIFASGHTRHVAGSGQEAAASHAAGWDRGDAEDRVERISLDVTDVHLGEVLQRLKPHRIFHLAARASGADADRSAVFTVNVEGTRNLLSACAKLEVAPRVLLVSTGYVYGNTMPERPAQESDPLAPAGRYGPYTDSKIEMEAVALEYPHLAIIVRAFSHTGPGQTPTFALPSFARQLARIEKGLEAPTLRVGNLEALRDMLDVRDVVRAYGLLIEQGRTGQIYNVATGRPRSMREYLDILRAECAHQTDITLDSARLRPADIACSTGDPARLHTQTAWEPSIPLEKTLQDTLNYWRTEIQAEQAN